MMSEPEITEATAHTILNYCMTTVTRNPREYKSMTFIVQIPFEALAKSCGLSKERAELYFGTALKVETKLSWVEHDFQDVEIISEKVEDDYE